MLADLHSSGTASTGLASPVPSRGDRGQATVEFALAFPVLVVMVLGLVQVGVSIRNELVVELAAREGARAAAVSGEPGSAATAAATSSVRLPISVATAGGGRTVTVTVRYVDDTDVPIIGALMGPITHTAAVTMAVEPP